MQTNIEKMRADLQDGRDKMRADIKHADPTFIIQFFGVAVTALAAGAAPGHCFIK